MDEQKKMNEWEEQTIEGVDERYWYPERVGETLQGVVITIENDQFENKIYLIETEDKRQLITPSHKVLTLKLKNVEVGNLVRIVYTGERAGKQGKNATKQYDVWRQKG